LEDPWGDDAIAVRFDDPEGSVEPIVRAGPFDGILAVADMPALIAARAAEAMGLRFHPQSAVLASRDKHVARTRFEAAGLPVPAFFRVETADDPRAASQRATYPSVLKPLGLSASRGVIRANDDAEFLIAFRRIAALLASPEIQRLRLPSSRYIQVESYIDGDEYAIEGVVTEGRAQVLAIFDKPDPLEGPYFEETIYVTPSRAPRSVQESIIAVVERAIAALGLSHGPFHAEARVNPRGVWMLEVAARPIGGLCAQALRFESGIPYEELLVRHAAGEDVSSITTLESPAGVMMIPIPTGGFYEDVDGLGEAAATEGVEQILITAKQGQKLDPLPEAASYLGFIFARGPTPDAVEKSLREAHCHLHFRIAPALPVLR
ncbi:MAG: ATP-grasp domain-containing protein, partial [Bryobacteraceae bacterium]